MKDRKVKPVLSRVWYQWEGRGHKERVKEDEYGRSILYSYVKMKQ
jgi:hypothetical protein